MDSKKKAQDNSLLDGKKLKFEGYRVSPHPSLLRATCLQQGSREFKGINDNRLYPSLKGSCRWQLNSIVFFSPKDDKVLGKQLLGILG
jgi:hypothetical protein